MWGQVSGCYYGRGDKRIIPTRVGTSLSGSEYRPILRDHPHACGDKIISATVRRNSVGSSPRVWGQVTAVGTAAEFTRIIPTRVGTRLDATHVGVGCTDHPHACGDKAAVKLFKLVRDVSSPRVWGQGLSALGFRLFLGIIPTRVGTSYTTGFLICQGGDHPHACGDKQSSD